MRSTVQLLGPKHLLEAMAESRVTADGVTHTLEAPFVVIATQNPVDHEGRSRCLKLS